MPVAQSHTAKGTTTLPPANSAKGWDSDAPRPSTIIDIRLETHRDTASADWELRRSVDEAATVTVTAHPSDPPIIAQV